MTWIIRNGTKVWVNDRKTTTRVDTPSIPTATPNIPVRENPITNIADPVKATNAIASSQLTLEKPREIEPVAPVRAEPTMATAEAPLKTITAPNTGTDFASLSDRDKQVNIMRKQADGIGLSEEEKNWKINQFLDQQEATKDSTGLTAIGDQITGQIEATQAEIDAKEQELLSEREKAIAAKDLQLQADLERNIADLQASGEKVKEAAGTALSFSGFGRSTFSAEQQADIQKSTENSIRSAKAAKDLQLQLFQRELEGADAEALAPMRENLANMRAEARQFELDSAVKVAELNEANKLNFEESFNNLLQTLDPASTQRTIDKDASAMLGYASDEFGNPIFTDENGEPIPLPKDDTTEWGTYTDRYGNTVFYDKANPSITNSPAGNSVYTNTNGNTASSPTSVVDNIEFYGEGDEFKRDDGSIGKLGENCVKWARENVPNLPWGLNSKQDKINAINIAEEQGFGSRDMTNVRVGDAILTGEGSVGHAAVVSGIADNGDLILAEANYTPGQITKGRTISRDDPKIYGFVTPNTNFGMSTVANEQGTNEGNNPAIATQVIAQTPEGQQMEFTRQQKVQFENYEKSNFDPKSLPAEYKTYEGEQQFKNEYAIWAAQQDNKAPNQAILDAINTGNFDDIIKASASSDGTPDQGFRNSWNKGMTVAGQFEAISNLIGKGSITKTDEFGNQQTIDWSPIKGWLAEKNPWDTDAATLQSLLVGTVPNLARGIFGEVGVLTDNDIRTYMKTIPNLRQTDDVKKAVASATLTLIRDSMKNQLKTQAQSGVNVAAFLQDYKDIEKKLDKINNDLGIDQTGEEAPTGVQTQTISQSDVKQGATENGVSEAEYRKLLEDAGYTIN